nr:hypothetical protein [uncultured Allomuricauda sp.]
MKNSVYYIFTYVLFFHSCGVAEPIFISNSNLQFKEVNDSDFLFTIDANIYNPTGFKYQLKELYFDIKYDAEKVGSGKLTVPQHINAKDTTALPFHCNLNLSQLQKKHKQILSQETSNFLFTGEAFAVHPLKKIRKGLEIKIPYDAKSFITDNILRQDLVLNQMEIEKINPFTWSNPIKSSFRLTIQIHNEQPFDFKIKQVQLSLKSKQTDKVVLNGVLDTIIDAPSHGTIKVPLNIESNNLSLLQNLGSFFLGKDNTKYIGSGFVVIDIEGFDFQIPFIKEFNPVMNSFGNKEVSPISDSGKYGLCHLMNKSLNPYRQVHNYIIKPTNKF